MLSSFFARIEDFTVAEWQSLTGVIAPRPRLGPPTDFTLNLWGTANFPSSFFIETSLDDV